MRRLHILLLITLLLSLTLSLGAEKLKRDVNGTPIQMPRYFTAVSDSIPSQLAAVYDSLAIPANAAEMMLIFRHQGGYIYEGAAKTLTADSADWIYVPKDIAVTFPVMDNVGGYLRYKSTTGAARINIIWKRM